MLSHGDDLDLLMLTIMEEIITGRLLLLTIIEKNIVGVTIVS